ncbi:LuxR family transcriptional regulator [Methylicorpusculum sp.]|uniref:LuxR family transcriptional regulator n=3 Tax=Methylicorpusculum sp. TaxID=2713644 RepID=UPI0027307438|nr:LuxR family transcriptional regulator [Methylicorpusculum sp.]MDP2180264.1 LuxR family transcriptional regulator [Methylicorpusculum sp.]MDP3528273.1 LuxR family transcriptional regulator [Methylicorpusculum sp.]
MAAFFFLFFAGASFSVSANGKEEKLRISSSGEFVNCFQETLMQSLLSAETEVCIFAALSSAAKKLGFEYCAYGTQMPLPISKPKLFMLNNYPKDWQQRYIQEGYLHIDPTVAHGKRSVMPLLWTDEVFTTCRPFWEDACAHGLKVGWAQSCHDAKGVGGLLTLARSDDNLSFKELGDLLLMMSWLAQAAHQGMSRLLLPKLMPEVTLKLSAREIEVLRWTAEGKTSGEVSMIMCIAERTVNFHINNAMAKLGTYNKTATVVKAAILGLL